jgi:NAD(P)-dependent dehydrogenase (short-subunit alcohol dehydrogenase family)
MGLEGTTAIVTGSARGLGEAYVRVLASEGAHVVIADLLEEEGRALAADLGSQATFERLDVTDQGQWRVLVAVDDATRLAYVEVLPDQTAPTAVGFLRRAIAWFAEQGITVREVMTDNGSAYKSFAWAGACADEFHITHIRTRPYRPRTNGKAERFIQTNALGSSLARP